MRLIVFWKSTKVFLNKYYVQGVFIASGPKTPRDGGIILALGDRKTIADIIQEDPFYQNGVADYELTQFEPTRFSPLFRKIIQSP